MISARDWRYYAQAMKLAELSECNRKHGAIITRGSVTIAFGVNKKRTHPVSRKHCGFDTCTVHAEQMALIMARSDVTGCTLYSAQFTGVQKSKPCDMCSELISIAGIKYVVYFDGSKLVKERV